MNNKENGKTKHEMSWVELARIAEQGVIERYYGPNSDTRELPNPPEHQLIPSKQPFVISLGYGVRK